MKQQSLLASLVLTILLSACGGGGTNSNGGATAAQTSSAPTAATIPGSATPQPVATSGNNSAATSNPGSASPSQNPGTTSTAGWAIEELKSTDGATLYAKAINNLGQVAGDASPTPAEASGTNTPPWPAFTYINGKVTKYYRTDGYERDDVTGFNDKGQIIGRSNTAAHTGNALLFLDGGNQINVGSRDFAVVTLQDINNLGQAVGMYETGNFPNEIDRSFLFYQGAMTDLSPTIPGTVEAINDSGHMAAYVNSHAALYRDGQLTDLGTLDGDTQSSPISINNQDEIVGEGFSPQREGYRAFLYSGGKMIDLRAAGGLKKCKALKINNRSQVLIQESPIDGAFLPYRYWLYDHGQFINLSDLPQLTAAGWSNVEIVDINDKGQIAGYGTKGGQTSSFILTPNS